ncbi:hypothetical protein R75471_07252 [Paraburkholderia domus]|nr:hypothetical protein R75471_07252 [Paraburkholderia domus]
MNPHTPLLIALWAVLLPLSYVLVHWICKSGRAHNEKIARLKERGPKGYLTGR